MSKERELTSQRIQSLMKKNHISYRELSDITGIAKSSLQRYVTNTDSKIPMDNARIIADKFNVSIGWLIGIEETNKSTFNSQFGTDQELIEYFHDQPELLSMYKDIQQSDSLQLLFDSTKDLSPEDLKPVLEYIYTIRKAKGLE